MSVIFTPAASSFSTITIHFAVPVVHSAVASSTPQLPGFIPILTFNSLLFHRNFDSLVKVEDPFALNHTPINVWSSKHGRAGMGQMGHLVEMAFAVMGATFQQGDRVVILNSKSDSPHTADSIPLEHPITREDGQPTAKDIFVYVINDTDPSHGCGIYPIYIKDAKPGRAKSDLPKGTSQATNRFSSTTKSELLARDSARFDFPSRGVKPPYQCAHIIPACRCEMICLNLLRNRSKKRQSFAITSVQNGLCLPTALHRHYDENYLGFLPVPNHMMDHNGDMRTMICVDPQVEVDAHSIRLLLPVTYGYRRSPEGNAAATFPIGIPLPSSTNPLSNRSSSNEDVLWTAVHYRYGSYLVSIFGTEEFRAFAAAVHEKLENHYSDRGRDCETTASASWAQDESADEEESDDSDVESPHGLNEEVPLAEQVKQHAGVDQFPLPVPTIAFDGRLLRSISERRFRERIVEWLQGITP